MKTFVHILLLIFPFVLFAKVHNVPTEFPTIQLAIDSSANGDTVLVKSGTYIECIAFRGKKILIKSEKGADSTIIDGNKNGSGVDVRFLKPVVTFNSMEDSSSILFGFTIQNGLQNYETQFREGGGIRCSNGSSPKILGCRIVNNSALLGGALFCQASSPLLDSCVLKHNQGSTRGSAIFCEWSSSPVVTNCVIDSNSGAAAIEIDESNGILNKCTITRNNNSGISLMSRARTQVTRCMVSFNKGTGIYSNISAPIIQNSIVDSNSGNGVFIRDNTDTARLVNTTIVCNGGFGIGFDNGTATVVNSIIWANKDSIQFDWGSTCIVSFSDVQGGYEGQNNMNRDPIFANATEHDYRLINISPCIDSGKSIAGLITDFNGNSRPYGSSFDIGAFEYTGSTKISQSIIKKAGPNNFKKTVFAKYSDFSGIAVFDILGRQIVPCSQAYLGSTKVRLNRSEIGYHFSIIVDRPE